MVKNLIYSLLTYSSILFVVVLIVKLFFKTQLFIFLPSIFFLIAYSACFALACFTEGQNQEMLFQYWSIFTLVLIALSVFLIVRSDMSFTSFL